MDQKKPYLPVSCSLYDRLTDLSVLGKSITIVVDSDHKEVCLSDVRIADIVTRNKEEFLVTDNGQEIRLDQIVSILP